MSLDTRDSLVKATERAARIRERDGAIAKERARCAAIARLAAYKAHPNPDKQSTAEAIADAIENGSLPLEK